MKKMTVLFALSSVLLLGACGNTQDTTKASERPKQVLKQQVKTEHLEDLVSYFKSQGFTVGAETQKAYTMIGALNGFGITLNGEQVELYEFSSASDPQLEQVKQSGKLSTESAYINGKFMLAVVNVDDKIVNSFKEFK